MTIQNDQIPAIYAQAIGKYKEITKEDLDVAFLSKLQSVDDLAKEIDDRNKSFSEYRHKRGMIFDAMQAALIPVELFGNLAAGSASMVFPPSSLVFGAVTYLVTAAKGVSSSYDAIEDLMGTLKVCSRPLFALLSPPSSTLLTCAGFHHPIEGLWPGANL